MNFVKISNSFILDDYILENPGLFNDNTECLIYIILNSNIKVNIEKLALLARTTVEVTNFYLDILLQKGYIKKENEIYFVKKISYDSNTNSNTQGAAPNTDTGANNTNSNTNSNTQDEMIFFENLLKEFNINFTKTNKESIIRLRKKMSKKEVESYLKELYLNLKENKQVKNIAALFSKKLEKGERQINSLEKRTNKTIVKEVTTINKKDILNKFNSLDEYDKLKIEEKAIKLLLSKDKKANLNVLMLIKENNKNSYYDLLYPYIKILI